MPRSNNNKFIINYYKKKRKQTFKPHKSLIQVKVAVIQNDFNLNFMHEINDIKKSIDNIKNNIIQDKVSLMLMHEINYTDRKCKCEFKNPSIFILNDHYVEKTGCKHIGCLLPKDNHLDLYCEQHKITPDKCIHECGIACKLRYPIPFTIGGSQPYII